MKRALWIGTAKRALWIAAVVLVLGGGFLAYLRLREALAREPAPTPPRTSSR